MRITIVLGPFYPVPPVLGGAVEKVHFLLADAYHSAGHDVTIMSRKFKGFRDHEVIDGVRHIRVASSNRSRWLLVNLILDFIYAMRVVRHLPKSDVTITNSFSLPLLLPRRTAGKIYVHVARFPKRQMLLYSRADRLQAISRSVADEITRQTPSLAKKVVTIGYPVPDDYFASNATPSRKKVILFVGRIAREKGVHVLISAFARMLKQVDRMHGGEWTLRIVGPHETAQGGDGPEYLRELVELAKPLGSLCTFAGPVFDKQALLKEYHVASVFAYPSLAETGEAFGLAALEAMAAGCAVIVSNLRCFDDFIEDGVSGLKFEHSGSNATANLTDKLTELVKEPELLEHITKNGNEAARRFQVSAIAGRMLEDFELLVASTDASRS